MQVVELLPDGLDLLLGQMGEWALGLARGMGPPLDYRLISTGPSAALRQVRIIWPSWP
jgi:hypothetical protein